MKTKYFVKFKIVLCVSMACFLIVGMVGCGLNEIIKVNTHENKESLAEKSTYELGHNFFGYKQFDNKVDGYSIMIPHDMSVDMSLSNVRAVLSNENETIEIYRQEYDEAKGITKNSYENYSNAFLKNDVDYHVEYLDTIPLRGFDMSIAQWSRKPLKAIVNDKCHYASVDIFTTETECITMLFKSNKPFGKEGEIRSYLTVLNSFKLIPKTEKGYHKKFSQVSNRKWDKNTEEWFHQYFGKDAPLSWGIFDKQAPLDFQNLQETEKKLDFKFPILLYYTGFIEGEDKHPNLEIALKNAEENGRTLELTLQTLDQNKEKGNMVYDVLNGEYDTYLKNYADEIKRYQKPILFRVGNEMNGDWCVYSAYYTCKDTDIYKAFYRYIYSIFENEGADNVIWIWNPNGKSFPDFKWNDALCYYPGDEYVDVIGMTNYNTGTYYASERWTSFADLYDDLYKEYSSIFDKPLMITEFASSSIGGDKAKWVSEMFQHIKTYDKLKVALWWSSCDYDANGNISRPYFIDENQAIIDVFRENLKAYKSE